MTEGELEQFRTKLQESMTFPSVYMFKFIIEADNRKIALLESLFGEDADLHTKESGSGKYISITAKEVFMNVDDIIAIYRRAAEVQGVMFL
jgi:uncharacterized protein